MSRALELSRAHAHWIEKNPLRSWRRGRAVPVTQATVAGVVHRSTQAIRDYEGGSYQPDGEVMVDIAGLLRLKPATLEQKWAAWLATRPT